MIPNRIESYCDLSGFAYLREYQGLMPYGSCSTINGNGDKQGGSDEPQVVVAEELDGDGKVVRSWYVLTGSIYQGDGRMVVDTLPHRLVSPNIRPNEPTPDYDPNAPVTLGERISDDRLRQIRAERNDLFVNRKRHTIYAQTYLDALKNADGWKSNVENLNNVVVQKDATIKERDNEIFELKNLAELNQLHITTLQASYLALENRMSLKERARVWCRSKLKRLECALGRAGLRDCCGGKCKPATGRSIWRAWFRR